MTDIYPERRHDDGSATGRAIMWIFVLGLMFWPRLFILGFAIFSPTLGRAFSGALIVIAGFILLPWTTLMYAAMWSISSNEVSGWEWIVVGIALLVDVYTWALGRRSLQ
jgi:hypothetical protein